VERSRRVILSAALDLLGDVGYGGLTVEAVATRAERDPEVLAIHRSFARDRRDVLVDLLADGVQTGEVPAGADLGLLAECLIGPIIVRRLVLHEPLDAGSVPTRVDQVLGAR
jgi:hypothetical protein